MAVDGINEFTESCVECGIDTPHEVTIKLVEGRGDDFGDGKVFSGTPPSRDVSILRS